MICQNTFWYVPYDMYGQHGCYVMNISLTKEEFEECRAYGRTPNGVRAAFFDNYLSALAYSQD